MDSKGIAVFISGRGSNMNALIERSKAGDLVPKINMVYSNRSDAAGLAISKSEGIPAFSFPFKVKNHGRLLGLLGDHGIELIALAGFMRIIPHSFLKGFSHPILNIHPSLLPSFKGLDAQKQAFEAGEKMSGATVHFVDDSLDGGEIIMQECIDISMHQNAQAVADAILEIEHKLYYKAVNAVWNKTYSIAERRANLED